MKHVHPSAPIVGIKIAIKALFLSFIICIFSTPAFSQTTPHELEHDFVVDGVITGSSVVFMLFAGTLLKEPLAQETCSWCNPPSFDKSVRNALKWNSSETPLRLSDVAWLSQVISINSMVAFAGYNSGRSDFIAQDLLLVAESVATTMVLTSVVKWIVGRERPFAHFNSDGLSKGERNLSFFSGHSSFTSSLAAASTTIAFLRGYDEAPWILGIGSTLALTTAYLRIAGDAHYFSDVVTGLLVGTGLGIGIPLLFHGRKENKTELETQNQSISLGLSSVNFRLSF